MIIESRLSLLYSLSTNIGDFVVVTKSSVANPSVVIAEPIP